MKTCPCDKRPDAESFGSLYVWTCPDCGRRWCAEWVEYVAWQLLDEAV
jgi:hypothetical protein